MIIDIPKLREEGEWFEGDEPASILELEGDSILRLEGSIHYRFFVQPVSGKLVVKGTLTLPLSVACGRCAEFYSTTLADSSFLRAYEISGGVETVDVTPDIREDVLLQLPSFPVCSPDCKGLCPQCGQNRNKGTCDCRPPEGNLWGALDGLSLK